MMNLYKENNTTYLDAPCDCNDDFLYGLYEKGFITKSFVNGQWRWVVLDIWAVKYLVTFYERMSILVVE
jgi:hypothetical protein